MRSISKAALSVLGFLLIAGGVVIAERPNPVLLNGKPFANAITIKGILAIPVQDFAKAAGGKVSLEPYFQLQGSTLTAKAASDIFAKLGDIKGESKDQQRLFNIQKVGVISTNVLMKNGKAYLPLADVAKAFGNTSWQGPITLRPGDSISLNFTTSTNGILGVRQ